jgi:hypothetical protein
MRFLIYVSDYIIPFIFFYIIGMGLFTKQHVFDDFITGAKDGFKVVLDFTHLNRAYGRNRNSAGFWGIADYCEFYFAGYK